MPRHRRQMAQFRGLVQPKDIFNIALPDCAKRFLSATPVQLQIDPANREFLATTPLCI